MSGPTRLELRVVGTPAPQGSKKGFYNKKLGRVQMVESSNKVKPWRQDVAAAVGAAMDDPDTDWHVPAGPVRVDITYYLARPKAHYRTGKYANQLKPTAPSLVDKKPDKDKLDRATHDALTSAGAIRDDAQIVDGRTRKVYADAATGARITITVLDQHVETPDRPAAHAEGEAAAAGHPPTSTEGALF